MFEWETEVFQICFFFFFLSTKFSMAKIRGILIGKRQGWGYEYEWDNKNFLFFLFFLFLKKEKKKKEERKEKKKKKEFKKKKQEKKWGILYVKKSKMWKRKFTRALLLARTGCYG